MSRQQGSGGGVAGRGALPIVGGAGVVLAIIVLVVVVASSGGGGGGSVSPVVLSSPASGASGGLVATRSGEPTVEATIDLNRPTAVIPTVANAPRPGAQGDRIVIRRFNVEAPLTYKAVGLDGVMPNPNGPDDVAFYDFAAWPGKGGVPGAGGNAVFSGHVDSGRVACKNGTVPAPCTAVFWDIHQLRLGDEVEVHLAGSVFKYRVTSNQPVSATSGDWDKIVSSTAQETITLITCGGDFNQVTREYTNRQVVVAVRI